MKPYILCNGCKTSKMLIKPKCLHIPHTKVAIDLREEIKFKIEDKLKNKKMKFYLNKIQ